VLTTSLPPQYAKWISLPGYLAELAKFANIENPTAAQEKDFLDALEGLHESRSKIPLSNKLRMAKKPNREKHGRDVQEWRSGKTARDEKWSGKSKLHRYTQRSIPPTSEYIWSSKTRARLLKLAKQIAAKHGTELEYSEVDDAPWIGPRYTMPDDWNWNSWAVLCEERLERMRTKCNSKWQSMYSSF
jgi:hypothetical protein